MKSNNPQDTVFQVRQLMDKLDYVLEVLRTESTLLQTENTILLDKVTKLEIKLTGARNNSSNLLKSPPSDIINPRQQKKHLIKHKIRAQINETEHKKNNYNFWTWIFRAAFFAVFKISAPRSSEFLQLILEKIFVGLLGYSYCLGYHKYLKGYPSQV